ncbi:MAG TPA: hypothetical protein VGM80_04055 [Gaiellaceae bacterium]
MSEVELDLPAEAQRTQMSPRDRRRFFVGLAVLMVVLFAGGMVGYIFDFRHAQVCPGGKQWLYQSRDDLGAVTYICPGGKTVTQGIVP